jgi:integrase
MLELPSPRHNRPVTWSQPRVAAWLRDGTRPKIAVWTPRQLAAFLTAVTDDDLYGLWWLAGLRGLRRGEHVGLRWVDVDLADATLTVTRLWLSCPASSPSPNPRPLPSPNPRPLPGTGPSPSTPPRSKSSPITGDGNSACTTTTERSPRETGLVFAWPDGRPIRPGWLTHRFAALVSECGLPPVRLHDLRHGAAMNALHGSASLQTVQHLLGDSSHAFTVDVYGTVPDALARAEARSTAATILTAMRHTGAVNVPPHRVDARRRRPHTVRLVRVVPSGLEADDVYAAAIDEQAGSNSRFPADSANAVRRAIQALYRSSR